MTGKACQTYFVQHKANNSNTFIIELYACILKIFAIIFRLPMNFLVSFGIYSTLKQNYKICQFFIFNKNSPMSSNIIIINIIRICYICVILAPKVPNEIQRGPRFWFFFFSIVSWTSFISKPESSKDLTIFLIPFISVFEIINVTLYSVPRIFY